MAQSHISSKWHSQAWDLGLGASDSSSSAPSSFSTVTTEHLICCSPWEGPAALLPRAAQSSNRRHLAQLSPPSPPVGGQLTTKYVDTKVYKHQLGHWTGEGGSRSPNPTQEQSQAQGGEGIIHGHSCHLRAQVATDGPSSMVAASRYAAA